MLTHVLALMAASVVSYLIHLLVGDYLSLPVEFFIQLVVGGAVYVVSFVKLKRMLG